MAGTALSGRPPPHETLGLSAAFLQTQAATGWRHCGRRAGRARQAVGTGRSAWNARRREIREIEMATERMARLGAANMAKMMGLLCVADSKLGELGEGEGPTTKAGDYSDVVVVDAEGRIIPWQRVARFDAAEMVRMRREIVDKLFTFLLNFEEPELEALRDHRRDETSKWHRPREDSALNKQMEVLASGIVESVRR